MTQGVGGSTAEQQLAAMAPWPRPAPAIARAERLQRLAAAQRATAAAGLDALLIGAGPSLRYFAGLGWSATERLTAMILPRAGAPLIVAPSFERGTLEAELAIAAEIHVWEEDASPFALVASLLDAAQARGVGVDPDMAFGLVAQLAAAAPALRLVDAGRVVRDLRMIKSSAELAIIGQAMAMTLEVQRRTARILRAGIDAREVAHFVEAAHRALGAPGNSFCAVQFGRATAFPHGLPGENILAERDMVLVDTGCLVQGYTSDVTRTYVFGDADAEQRAIWAIEHAAQAAAFGAVRPGALCEDIDAAARSVLEAAGLGPGYRLPGLPHRTGHGIGLSIHEPPYLVRGDATPLQPGMCCSNEPMIVLPGRFGVRLEDHFHVTETGAAWFTPPSPSIDAPFGEA